jgi:hypothetical protein
MREEDVGIVLLAAAERAPDGVEPEELGRVNGLVAEVLVPQGGRPLGESVRKVLSGGNRFFP